MNNTNTPTLSLSELMEKLHPGSTVELKDGVWRIVIPPKEDTSLFSLSWYKIPRSYKIHIYGMHPPSNYRDRIDLLWMHEWFTEQDIVKDDQDGVLVESLHQTANLVIESGTLNPYKAFATYMPYFVRK